MQLDPYVRLKWEPWLRHNERYEGFYIDVLEEVARKAGVTFQLRLAPDGQVGSRGDDGTWNGLIGQLSLGKADVAAAAFRVEKKQERLLSYSKPFMHSTLSILMASPSSGAGEDWPVFFMEDLLNHTDLSLGVIKSSRAEKLLRKSKMPLYRKIWRKIRGSGGRRRAENIVRRMSDAVAKVRNGDYALILESTEAAYQSLQPPCDLMALDQFMSITNYAFALPKDSPLVDGIDRGMLQLQEDGVLQRLFHTWWNSGEC
ncbi:hypothetical protein CAPTEDRAFT_167463, partial [Capitella teleta]